MHLTIFLLGRVHLYRSETIVTRYFRFYCCLQKLFNIIFNSSFWVLFLTPRAVLWTSWKLLKVSKMYHSFVWKVHYGYPKDILKAPNAILWVPESILILSLKCLKSILQLFRKRLKLSNDFQKTSQFCLLCVL